MIPILYESTETAFTSNGLGRLRDCISCVVTEERNGIYECDFEYPVDGHNYELIKLGRIIAVEHDDTTDVQPFDIISCTRPLNGVVEFHAVHISYRQSKMVVSGSNINNIDDAFAMLGDAVPSNPFTYFTDQTGQAGYVAAADGVPRSVRQMLGGVEGSILDTYRGEYQWNKFTVNFLAQRGTDRDFTVRYGVDLTEYNEEIDYSESFSSAIPYWTGAEEMVVGDKQTVSGITYTGREECVPLDLTEKFESRPTKAQLEAYAQSYLNSLNTVLPKQTITIDFIRLKDTLEHSPLAALHNCQLCDTIKVDFPRYNVKSRFKIVKTVYDVLKERFVEMELGTLSTSLSEALGITSRLEETTQTAVIGVKGKAETNYRRGNVEIAPDDIGVLSGVVDAVTVNAGAYRDFSVDFGTTLSNAPNVVACFDSQSTDGAFGKCSLSVHSITTTGFKIRMFNGDTANRAPKYRWIAVLN